MDLERISVVLRPRGALEAMDLGLALFRAHRRVVWATWAMTVLPVYALTWVILYRWPPVAYLVLWWLKPAFDRVPLAILSAALFGTVPSAREAVAGLRRQRWPRLLRSLTLARLSPGRAFLLPIWQLEGQTGPAVRRRERVLGKGTFGPAASLMAVCAGLEQALVLSGLSLILWFTPDNLDTDAWGIIEAIGDGQTPLWFSVALGVVHALAVAFVEPLYVAAGFGLYVNRRLLLEGWDVELGFRRLLRRLGGALAVLLALGLAPTASADPVPADDPIQAEAVRADLEEILARPEFPHTETQWVWKLPERSRDTTPWQLPFGPVLALIIKGLALVLLGVGVYALVRALLRYRPSQDAAVEAETADAQVRLPALLGEVGELPLDVAETAWRWWVAGRRAEALGLLYSASLLDLVRLRGVGLAEGDTESDCLVAARPALPPDAWTYLSALTRAWQGAAYAHSLPEDAAVQILCRDWPHHFRRAP